MRIQTNGRGVSFQHAYYAARNLKKLNNFSKVINAYAADGADYLTVNDLRRFVADVKKLGIGLDTAGRNMLTQMTMALDAIQPSVTTASIPVPIQFLQNWMPGFVEIVTAARKIDDVVGLMIVGDWLDEEVIQMVLEPLGTAVLYGDHTNVPLSTWNPDFERRTIVRFEEGLQVGRLEEGRAARLNISSGEIKRGAAALALEIQRNRVGFFGFNGGNNRTYGFLNDPSLPAYITSPNGASGSPLWSSKTFLEITKDIRTLFATLRSNSKDVVDPENVDTTLALATAVVDSLSVTSDFNISVRQWLRDSYPRCRVVSAPELTAANGGANVGYLFAERLQDGSTDDGRIFDQLVQTKFQVMGVQQTVKGYLEDYSNATAGIMCKRPFGVQRITGI